NYRQSLKLQRWLRQTGIKQAHLALATFNKKMLPHNHLTTNGGVTFEPLLAREKGFWEAMRLKSVLSEVEVRIDDREPFVAEPFEAQLSRMMPYIPLSGRVLPI